MGCKYHPHQDCVGLPQAEIDDQLRAIEVGKTATVRVCAPRWPALFGSLVRRMNCHEVLVRTESASQ